MFGAAVTGSRFVPSASTALRRSRRRYPDLMHL